MKFDDSTQIGSVHITEYAQASLGDVVFVELPAQGSKVKQTGQYRESFELVLSEGFNRTNWSGGECKGCIRYCTRLDSQMTITDRRIDSTLLFLAR